MLDGHTEGKMNRGKQRLTYVTNLHKWIKNRDGWHDKGINIALINKIHVESHEGNRSMQSTPLKSYANNMPSRD